MIVYSNVFVLGLISCRAACKWSSYDG